MDNTKFDLIMAWIEPPMPFQTNGAAEPQHVTAILKRTAPASRDKVEQQMVARPAVKKPMTRASQFEMLQRPMTIQVKEGEK